MTTKLTANRYRIRRPADPAPVDPQTADPTPVRLAAAPQAPAAAAASAPPLRLDQPAPPPAAKADTIEGALDAIRREGLTGRQLRLARRMAQKHDLPATSDFDAVRVLRQSGIDPFQRASMLDIVTGDGPPVGGAQTSRELAPIPQRPGTMPAGPITAPSPQHRADVSHAAEILKIQRDILKRRRRRATLLFVRLCFFVALPTLFAAWYYYKIATPFFATRSEFVIQQSEAATGGLGSLFSGTQFATSQDSIAVQGYLQSRDAMQRLDKDLGFRAHFTDPAVDPLQRLAVDATDEAAYKIYKRNVKISYDPTEGLVRLEVAAADPDTAVAFAKALIGYAEEQVDHLTQRLREDQMKGARDSYDDAETKMVEAQRQVVTLQEKYKVLSSEVEVSLITSQISGLETQLTQDRLSLAQMESNETPNLARMEPLKRRIATLESEISDLRSRLTEDSSTGLSLAKVQSELLVAQADLQTRQLLMAQSLQQLETARIEANRQVRYLSLSVNPTAPDEASYPRAFENTMVALLIFSGIYLMISMTAAILREQMTA
jgi:capsular polysaccharide transport system permease protein